MANRYAAGEYLREIADDYGVCWSTVARAAKKHGVDTRPRGYGSDPRVQMGEKNAAWKGGRHLKDGYWQVLVAPDDPFGPGPTVRANRRYVPEHRLVMARAVGRPLRPDETVHHINGDRQDNRLENLQLRNGKHGKGSCWRCSDCGSVNLEPVKIKGENS